MRQFKTTVPDGTLASAPESVVAIDGAPATIMVTVSAGSCPVFYTSDPLEDVLADPANANWEPWDFGIVDNTAIGIGSLHTPISCIQCVPSGADANVSVTIA